MGHEHVNNVALRNARPASPIQSSQSEKLLELSPGAGRSRSFVRARVAHTLSPLYNITANFTTGSCSENQGTTLAICSHLQNVHYVHMLRQICSHAATDTHFPHCGDELSVPHLIHCKLSCSPLRSSSPQEPPLGSLALLKSSAQLPGPDRTHTHTPPLTVYYSCVGSSKTRSCCSISAAAQHGHRM